MKITVLTLFPKMFDGILTNSIIKRALENQLIEIEIIDFRQYSLDKNNKVDDYPYGGGAGMVIAAQPVFDCLKDVNKDNGYVVMTSPVGLTYNQEMAHQLAQKEHIIIICGHYEGYDERIITKVDQKISIGDYILTGGEIAAMVICDSIARLLDGVITKQSTINESFENGLLEYPQYTRPEEYEGQKVPEVLLSGHHENIRQWRLKKSLELTLKLRPDLLEKRELSFEEKKILEQIIAENVVE